MSVHLPIKETPPKNKDEAEHHRISAADFIVECIWKNSNSLHNGKTFSAFYINNRQSV